MGGLLLEERIGTGGMGVVFRAYDASIDRNVAVKVLAAMVAEDPGFRARLLREASAAERVRHPNVVRVHEVGTTEGGATYIVMHHVAGPSIARLIERDGALSPRLVVRMLGQVAGALDAVHRAGLLHLDVKPGNILWDPESETAYLADFGLAAAVRDAPGRAVPGFTPGYAAPEQLFGGDLSGASDVYALACTAFHCLTGHPPFPGDGARVRAAQPAGVAPALREDGDLPAGLLDALERALAPNPTDRFSRATEFAAAVRAARWDVVFLVPEATPHVTELVDGLRREGFDVIVADPADERRLGTLLPSARTVAVCVDAAVRDDGPVARVVEAALTSDPGLRVLAVLTGGAPPPNHPALGPMAGFGWFDVRAEGPRDVVAEFRDVMDGASRGRAIAGACPYPGLEGFEEGDAAVFAGREREVARLEHLLATHGFAAVVGASGSGKSSMLRAGLLGRSDRTDALVVTPAATPLEHLRRAMCDGRATLVVVDQFEELFLGGASRDEQDGFIAALFAHRDAHPANRVIIAVRADLMGRCAEFSVLRDAMAHAQVLLGPLGSDDLRRALEEPARTAGLRLSPGLVERVVEEAGEIPGALPLVSDLMRQIWERRQQNTLTIAALVEAGGVRGAVARRADAAYAGLTGDDRRWAREMMPLLVSPGEGTADSRRRVTLSDLQAGHDADAVRRIIDILVAQRLVTVDAAGPEGAPSVEIVHEALIHGWPRLREWVDHRRDRLVQRTRLTHSADRWLESGEDEAHLLRGSQLAIAQELDPATLPRGVRRLVQESTDRAEQDRRRERQRFRRTVGGLSIGIVLTSALAVVAFTLFAKVRDSARRQHAELLLNRSQQLRARDPAASLRLATQAVSTWRAPQTVANLRSARAVPVPRRVVRLTSGGDPFDAVPLAGGAALVAASDGVVVVDATGARRRLSSNMVVRKILPLRGDRALIVGQTAPRLMFVSAAGRIDHVARIAGLPQREIQDVSVSPGRRWLGLLTRPGVACRVDLAPDPVPRAHCTRPAGMREAETLGIDDRGGLILAGNGRVWDSTARASQRARTGFASPLAVPGTASCFLLGAGRDVTRICAGRLQRLLRLDAGERVGALALGDAAFAGGIAPRVLAVGLLRADGSPEIAVYSATRDLSAVVPGSVRVPVPADVLFSLRFRVGGRVVSGATSGGALMNWDVASLVMRRARLPVPAGPLGSLHLEAGPSGLAVGGAWRLDLDGGFLASVPLPAGARSPGFQWAPRSDTGALLSAERGRPHLDVFSSGVWKERSLSGVRPPVRRPLPFGVGDGGDVAVILDDGRALLSRHDGTSVVLGAPSGPIQVLRVIVAPSGDAVAAIDLSGQLRWWSADDPGRAAVRFGSGGRQVVDVAFARHSPMAAVLTAGSVFVTRPGDAEGRQIAFRGDQSGGVVSVDDGSGLILVRDSRTLAVLDPAAATEVYGASTGGSATPGFLPADIAYDPRSRNIVSLLRHRTGAGWEIERRSCGCMNPIG